jgi:hypothetical protein
MLLTENTIRHIYGAAIIQGQSMPRKNMVLILSRPFDTPVGIWWTDKKNDAGKRLFNVGSYLTDGKQPGFFST